MNQVLKAIQDRRSNRGFSNVPLTQDQLNALIDAALASPTARNTQQWHFSFVQNAELLNRISEDFFDLRFGSQAPDRDTFHVFYHAPTVVFISIPNICENRFVEIDAGIACENLAIAAQGMGLGSVIIGMVKDIFLTENEAAYNQAVGIPEGYHFAIAIAIGNPTITKEAHPIGEGKVTIIQ